jgi:uncharacterized protein with HEPN domain
VRQRGKEAVGKALARGTRTAEEASVRWANGLTCDDTLRNLELIGEAATHIPDEVQAGCPEIPRRMIIATRNRLIHGYLGIDDDT